MQLNPVFFLTAK